MAKCKLCNKDIPDGVQYCDNCLSLNEDKADEAYLDSLLNSVKDTDRPALDAYKNKKKPDNIESNIDPEFLVNDDIAELLASVDLGDLLTDTDIGKENKTTTVAAEPEAVDKTEATADETGLAAVDQAEEETVTDIEAAYGTGFEDTEAGPETFEADPGTAEDVLETPPESFGVDEDVNKAVPEAVSSNIGSAEDDDILALLSQLSPDDPIARDALAISSMLQGKPVAEEPEIPKDVGKVFSNALKVVSSLDEEVEEEIPVLEPEKPDVDVDGHKEMKKPHKAKKQKDESKVGRKRSLLVRLFGNVKDEKAPAEKGRFLYTLQDQEAAEVKKSKRKKKKGKQEGAEAEEELRPSKRMRAEKEEAPKPDKKALNAQKKKERQEKRKEARKAFEELDDDEGRINRVGASIVFLFFGILALLLLAGTNIFSYSLRIKNAENYFERHKYTEAFDEVYGIDLKDEDIKLYDRIMTVMFVNKQLNSYNHYYDMEKYPEAMDSLLKGLDRYDKYIRYGTFLGVESDLDYVREQIVAELYNVFNLSEEEAMAILASESRTEYSLKIYDYIIQSKWEN
jgi:hypothetical protein